MCCSTIDFVHFIICCKGANSGIGKETALEIAKRGGTVHLVCRFVEGARAYAGFFEGGGAAKNFQLHRGKRGRAEFLLGTIIFTFG